MKRIAATRRENALRAFADAYGARHAVARLRGGVAAAQREAQDAERARQAFLSGLNHELRTPLNHIIGFAELLRQADEYGLPAEKREEYAEVILGAANTLLDQINGILMAAGYGEPSSGEEAPDSGVVPVLRRLLQEHAGALFVGKVEIADNLPASSLSSRDVYRALQMVFSVLSDSNGKRRAIGLAAAAPGTGEAVTVTLSLLSGAEAIEASALRPARAEIIRLGGRLDHMTTDDIGERVVISLPAERMGQAA